MKISNFPVLLVFILFTFLGAGCTNNKQKNSATKQTENGADAKTEKTVPAKNDGDLVAPDFADPVLKQYYSDYTAYLKKVVASIRNKDETGTMAIFNGQGKQFSNMNDMDQKAKAADGQKFTNWLMKAFPYQKEIVQSDYYKKFNEEYYKNVKENFEKKQN